MSETFQHALSQRLREVAMAFPETTEGASCVNRAFKAAGKKNFLFLGEKDGRVKVMVKLVDGVPEAEALAADHDITVGKAGWTTGWFDPDGAPEEALVRWVGESFRLLAPKSLLKRL
jgi:hypothetical protein